MREELPFEEPFTQWLIILSLTLFYTQVFLFLTKKHLLTESQFCASKPISKYCISHFSLLRINCNNVNVMLPSNQSSLLMLL